MQIVSRITRSRDWKLKRAVCGGGVLVGVDVRENGWTDHRDRCECIVTSAKVEGLDG